MVNSSEVISQTKKWINDVIIGCNFCPFAANVVKQQTVRYQVEQATGINNCLEAFLKEMNAMNEDSAIETTFLIFPNEFVKFDDYLHLVALAEKMLRQKGYEGIYQLASFHPLYHFNNTAEKDAANYTNRSVYPMLHLLRESSIDKVLEHYTNPGNIPTRNINFAREKGLTYMKMLRDACC